MIVVVLIRGYQIANLIDSPSTDIVCVENNLKITDQRISFEDRTHHLLVVGYPTADTAIKYGMCFRASGNYSKISNTYYNPSSFRYDQYMLSHKIKTQLQLSELQPIGKISSVKIKLMNLQLKLANRNCQRYASCAYINALALGYNQIDSDIKQVYSIDGLSYLFALSGSHLAIIGLGLSFLLASLRIKKNTATGLTIITLLLYVILTGLSPSLCRAWLMLFLLFSNKLSRKDSWLISIGVMLILNPLAILNPSFVLSYFVTAIILWLLPTDSSDVSLLGVLKFNYLIWLLSIPLVNHFNYQINPLAPILSLLIAPLIMTIGLPLAICLTVLNLPMIAHLFTVLFSVINLVAVFGSNFAFVSGRISIIEWLIFAIGMYILYRKKKYLIIGIWFVIVSLDYSLFPAITMIDCGQGDCFVIEQGFSNYAIDFGPPKASDEVIKAYHYLGVNKFKTAVISHFHADHYGGFNSVSEKFKIEEVLIPTKGGVVNGENVKIVNQPIITENVLIIPVSDNSDNLNNNGLVIKVKLGTFWWLLSGDIEAPIEKQLVDDNCQLLRSDGLKVGHHGSNTSSTEQFLNCVDPQIGLISSGRGNMYHHPSPDVVERMTEHQIKTFNTQFDGMVRIVNYPERMKVKKYHEER